MHQPVHEAQPSQQARDLARYLTEQVDLQRRILMETIESAETGDTLESGRTICPSTGDPLRGPLGRFPRAVELQECPIGAAGIMHSHVSIPQLRNPEHSLPDISIVLFEAVDASLVVGVDSHDILLGPANPDAAIEVFEDAIGRSITGTPDVVAALQRGEIPDPSDARRRVRSRLGGLFDTQPSGFQDLAARIDALADHGALPARQPIEAACPHHASADLVREPARSSSVVSRQCAAMRGQRTRVARSVTARGFFPPIQLSSTDQPISLVDTAVQSGVTAGVLLVAARVGGPALLLGG